MSNKYIYSGDQAIIIQDGAIIWDNQCNDESSLQYFDATDSSINESNMNEGYITASDSNETQYLSIVEQSDSNDVTLEDLHNLTVENVDVSNGLANNIHLETAEPVESSPEAEVIVFTVDGSDDLYGIQLTHDETGNIQKYQFKFRTTADGQLEPIPETVTLLPRDDQTLDQITDKLHVIHEQNEDTESENQEYFLVPHPAQLDLQNFSDDRVQNDQVEGAEAENIYIKGEVHSPTVSEDEVGEIENVASEILEPCIDGASQDTNLEIQLNRLHTKIEIAETTAQAGHSFMSGGHISKEEKYFEPENEDEFGESDVFDESIENATICKEEHFVNVEQQQLESYPDNEIAAYQNQDEETITQLEQSQNHVDLDEQFIRDSCQIEVQYETELEASERTTENSNGSEEENVSSEAGQYQLAETYSEDIVGSQEVPTSSEVVDNYQEPIFPRSNILRHPSLNTGREDKSRKPLVSVNYYVVYPEKENVNSLADDGNAHSHLPLPKLAKSNPRSVLRTSFPKQDKPQKPIVNPVPQCDLYHKRFAKNKDAMRAKHFHNFLNRTTIPHAPIRKHRQPRKQEIKPVVERSDEEIIVQEVLVSSAGFIESLNRKVRNKNMQVTAFVELSDSEEDSGKKAKRSQRKTHHLLANSSDSEISIIEIPSDNEESSVLKSNSTNTIVELTDDFKRNKPRSSPVTLKRRRGRPPKNKTHSSRLPLLDHECLASKPDYTERETVGPSCINIVPVTGSVDNGKKEIICPFCPKTFPSQNSLNTHIIHHNLENTLKDKAKMSSRPSSVIPRQSILPKLEYNHKCDECQETFRNTILLQKHNCTKKTNSHSCSVCLRQFRDIALLNIHKKSHAKSNLAKNTNVTKILPIKFSPKPSAKLMKSPVKKSPKKSVKSCKCSQCPKVCDSEEKLAAHIKTHKKYLCSSCSSTFSSKLLLDTHVRTNCVKMKPANKRLSFTVRKSFIHTPPRRLSMSKLNEKSPNKRLNHSVLSVKVDCNMCEMKFSTFRNLYTHKVQKHGLSTPDKSLMTKPKQGIYKPRAVHGGIPANDRLKRAYAALRQKLAETENLVIQ